MARTGLVLDERFERHDTGVHPECPARLAAIRRALAESGLEQRCVRIEPRPIALNDLHRVHDPRYVQRIEAACRQGGHRLDADADTVISPESYETALLAAGSVCAAVDEVMAGRIGNAFCAVRPPGHHAERDHSSGFCLFNNIALAAERLLQVHELERVFILDWDVHHCNGTQHTFEATPAVFVCSLHGHPRWLFPGTGYESEVGVGDGVGYTLNIPMPPRATGEHYREAFAERIGPAVNRCQPQFVLVSAGFDAHRRDPLAPLCLETNDFEWMTRWALDAARQHCQGRLVSVLEGGYDLTALAESVVTHLTQLLNDAPTADPE